LKIYADTSFLVALLYRPDRRHPAVRQCFQNQTGAEWVNSSWSLFETANTLRQLSLSRPGPAASTMEACRRLLKHWHDRGSFRTASVQIEDALFECQRLSAAYATGMRMRAADVLHVALLEQIEHDLFVTGDHDQHALAKAHGYPCQLI
jgi:predicted nucleic acid-binding protein